VTRPLPEHAVSLLDRFADDVQEIMCCLRERVLAVAPNASETISDVGYTVSLQYGPDDKVGRAFCYIAGFSKHANLGFQSGAGLPDPESVLEGTGAQMRHIKFATVTQTNAPWVDDYLEAALAFRGLDSRIGDGRSRTRLKPA